MTTLNKITDKLIEDVKTRFECVEDFEGWKLGRCDAEASIDRVVYSVCFTLDGYCDMSCEAEIWGYSVVDKTFVKRDIEPELKADIEERFKQAFIELYHLYENEEQQATESNQRAKKDYQDMYATYGHLLMSDY